MINIEHKVVKFNINQKVTHVLNGFEGYITAVVIKPEHIHYEVLPLTDADAKWVEPVWIDECLLKSRK